MKSKSFKTKIGLLKHLPGMHYLEIPNSIIKAFGGKFHQRFFCTVNSKLKFQGGIVALGKGKGYISISKKRMQECGVKLGSNVNLKLELDDSKYGMQIPEELDEVLKQDSIANKRFHNLTPGKQRYIIHYVASVKSSDKRLDRAVFLIENLKNTIPGKETFRKILGIVD